MGALWHCGHVTSDNNEPKNDMNKITCGKNHSGNKSLHKHGKGLECAGCGQYYIGQYIVTAKLGMTPFATENNLRAANKSAKQAKRLGLDGAIIIR